MQNCLARWWPFDRNASSSLCCACMRVRLFSSRNDSVWEQEGRAAGRRGSEREREREGLQTSHSSSSASRGLWMRPVQTTRSEDYSCCLVAYAQKASGAEKGAAAHIELAAVTLMSKVIRRGFFLFLAFLLSLSLSMISTLFYHFINISSFSQTGKDDSFILLFFSHVASWGPLLLRLINICALLDHSTRNRWNTLDHARIPPPYVSVCLCEKVNPHELLPSSPA